MSLNKPETSLHMSAIIGLQKAFSIHNMAATDKGQIKSHYPTGLPR